MHYQPNYFNNLKAQHNLEKKIELSGHLWALDALVKRYPLFRRLPEEAEKQAVELLELWQIQPKSNSELINVLYVIQGRFEDRLLYDFRTAAQDGKIVGLRTAINFIAEWLYSHNWGQYTPSSLKNLASIVMNKYVKS